jgi:para-aminobenzoate synthetase component 1
MTTGNSILNRISSIERIQTESLDDREAFIDLAGRFAHLPGTVALISGGRLDCARYHILALRPWLSFYGKKNQLHLKLESHEYSFQADPLKTLKEILIALKGKLPALLGPIQAGLFGYLSYDLKDHLETLPRTTVDDLNLPEICFFAPSLIVVQDRIAKTRCLHRVILDTWDAKTTTAHYDWFKQMCDSPPATRASFKGVPATLKSNFSKADYLSALEDIHEYIASGHVYQVNMSQRFSMAYSGSGFDLFKRLFKMNPAPFFAYIQAEGHEIVSTSPERFLLQKGRKIETRPIKGTRKRGETKEEDHILRDELLNSPKEDAELAMIVDLMRNDLGRVCTQASVKVAEHKRVEAYQNVFHLISIVTGELKENCDAVDVIAETFPGGSITGCPKVRCMEIIDELEPTCRHLYTGSIGYISLHDTMDLSIAIRTAILTQNRIHFGVGGGIVFDSNPKDEFEETLHKGRTLMAACLDRKKTAHEDAGVGSKQAQVWLNGRMVPADQAKIPISDPGFQYGFGFFETIRVEQGRPLYLNRHLTRFKKSWQVLYQYAFPDLSWEAMIKAVLEKNNLTTGVAAVKMMTAWAESDEPPYHPHLIITARPYTHRLTLLGRKGLHLGSYPHPRQSPLADHKTLNYLYYHQAGRWARANGYDEALILNPDGSISETNSANVAVICGKQLIVPTSPHVLPGVMMDLLQEAARQNGFEVLQQPLLREMLLTCDHAVVTNALMQVTPILSLDGQPLNFSEEMNQTAMRGWIKADK